MPPAKAAVNRRDAPAVAAEARALAVVIVDVLVLLVLERLGALALARTRPIALKPNQTAPITTTRISSFIGLNMSHAPIAQRTTRRQTQARRSYCR